MPSYDVLRKAAAEDRARARYYPCVIEDLNLIKRVSKRLDSSERLQCDIHLLSDSPLMVHMYNEHFLRKYGEKPTTLHLDATGSVTKTVGTTHPYFYSLVAEDVDGAYPVGHMLAEMHTVPAITFFLQQIAHDLKIATYGTRKMTPPRVVTDYSWAMLHGISLTFAGMSLPAYIDCAWAAAIGEVPMPSIVMSLCSCHLAHDASRAPVTHIGKQKTRERQMLLWLFGQMQQAKTVGELDNAFSNICRLLLSQCVPALQMHCQADTEEPEGGAADRLETSQWQSYRRSTAPGRHFDSV